MGVIQEWEEDTWMYKVLLKKCKGRKKDIEEWVASTEVHAAVPEKRHFLFSEAHLICTYLVIIYTTFVLTISRFKCIAGKLH